MRHTCDLTDDCKELYNRAESSLVRIVLNAIFPVLGRPYNAFLPRNPPPPPHTSLLVTMGVTRKFFSGRDTIFSDKLEVFCRVTTCDVIIVKLYGVV